VDAESEPRIGVAQVPAHHGGRPAPPHLREDAVSSYGWAQFVRYGRPADPRRRRTSAGHGHYGGVFAGRRRPWSLLRLLTAKPASASFRPHVSSVRHGQGHPGTRPGRPGLVHWHRDLTAAAENICCRQAAARLPASELFGPRQSGNEDKGPCLACPGLAHDLTGGLARAARRKKRS
jgi:hypothetical protein